MDAPAQERPKRVPKPLIELLGQKLKADLEPTDPIFLVTAAVEDLQKKALADISEVVTGLADQIAASAVMAENSAKAMSEKMITQGTEWATKKIREAGEAAAADVRAAAEKAKAEAAVGVPWLKAAIIVAVVCSVSALAAAASTLVAIWVG